MQQHLLVAAATVDPSPAFQSRGSGRIVVLVAAATVDPDLQYQPSLPRLGADALMVPALKSRARIKCRSAAEEKVVVFNSQRPSAGALNARIIFFRLQAIIRADCKSMYSILRWQYGSVPRAVASAA